MNKNTVRQLLNVIGLVIALVVNVLATQLPLNGITPAQVSDRFPALFVPAGYVFAIWGVIYLGLIAFTIYQALPSQRENPRLQKMGLLFFFSNILNSLWLFSYHYLQLGLGLVIISIFLFILIRIYTVLEIGKKKVGTAEFWLVNLPFSIYLGWLTVATIANATQLLYSLNWNGFGISGEVWTLVMLTAAVIISVLVSSSRRDAAFALVLVWAFVGISVKQSAVPMVANGAMVAAAAVAILYLLYLILKPKKTS
jgi:benzodiazapine receptor